MSAGRAHQKMVMTPFEEELDALVKRLAAIPSVRRAFWSPSTTE
jgi:hypothetical protein